MSNALPGGVVAHYSDQDVAMGAWREMFILLWRDETTVDGIRKLRSIFRMWSNSTDGPLSLITIVQQNCPMPPVEARKDLGRWLGEISDRIRASAVVYEGEGFKSASVRGVVTGLTLLARQAYPHKIFATVRDAAQWVSKTAHTQGVEDLTASGILSAVETLRLSLP